MKWVWISMFNSPTLLQVYRFRRARTKTVCNGTQRPIIQLESRWTGRYFLGDENVITSYYRPIDVLRAAYPCLNLISIRPSVSLRSNHASNGRSWLLGAKVKH
ncbi:hypothetical protein PM082_015869 [Marasmius tenuissimus]|nr:hypothetical protein PM082_015869 [Marasmius tenuissimus]